MGFLKNLAQLGNSDKDKDMSLSLSDEDIDSIIYSGLSNLAENGAFSD